MLKERKHHYIKAGRRHWELVVIAILVALVLLVLSPYLSGDRTFAEALLGREEKEAIKNVEDRTIKEAEIREGKTQDEVNVNLNVTPE